MATSQMSGVIQHLRRTMLLRGGAGLTDGQLLTDYLSRRDEAALAALVHRHGPMVWGVCRRVLHDHHDAEDAFQASFLVLVRKAGSIASRELLANWLYGVAHQTALKARATALKRKGRERQVTQMPEAAAAEQDLWHDLQPLLDEELRRLPDKYRAVVVLCDLEDKTRKEVARQLGCPEGTVAGRLARARRLLAKQLARRGVVLSGGAVAAMLSQNVAAAGVPPAVVSSTIKAASLFAAGQSSGAISAKVAALTAGVLKAMFVTKIKSVLTMLVVIAALTATAGLIYRTQAAAQPTAKEEPGAARKNQNPVAPVPKPPQTDQQRMVGTWIVVDGKSKGQKWWIGEDRIHPNPNRDAYRNYGFAIIIQWFYRLDASKTPKQIDMTFQWSANNRTFSKGIYALEGDELRLCLGEQGKDRPEAFPNPGAGAVIILRRTSKLFE